MRERKKVGEILVEAGIIDAIQLKAALGEQSRWGRRLGVTLIKMGMVEEGHLIRALAKQLDLPVASLAGKRIPEDVIALVPARVAAEHGVIPLFTKQEGKTRQLFLGMEDPSNLDVLDDLSFRTGMEIHPVMVGPSELGEAIDRYYHQRDSGAARRDPFQSGDTMSARSLRIVTDDTAHPGTKPAPISGSRPKGRTVAGASVPAKSKGGASPAAAAPEEEAAIELSDPIATLPDGLLDDVAKAVDETERTRLVAKALTQLLIEKGVLELDEIQAKVESLKAATATDAGD